MAFSTPAPEGMLRAMIEDRHSQLFHRIRTSLIGADHAGLTPFGLRRVSYADYTASGRSLSFIEDLIRDEVMPLYANTHSEVSVTGRQTTRFREDARRIIHQAVGGSDDDVVIFAGSGATGAINKILDILNLRIPADLDDRYALSTHIPEDERPVVFVGPYEHHSNELPWRESIADVITIAEDADGQIDQAQLERELVRYAARPLKIGSFSAASNVTGIASDTRGISKLLHDHGALAFWDYAAAGPYLDMSMNAGPAETEQGIYKDAVFLSPHKFVGGPGTPGVLVVKKSLLKNRVPSIPGGGTVSYVNQTDHRYLRDPVHREEGGTPAILESIRAGLVFRLKEEVGTEAITEREHSFVTRAIASWSENPNLSVLGNKDAWRLSIVSFTVRDASDDNGRFLHHNFVVALLNDLFGIQVRGGCSCAGPYGHRLLGIDLEYSRRLESQIVAGCEVIKPGWVRMNFNYFISEASFAFLLEAVHLVANEGWRLLPEYDFDAVTGLWTHRRSPRGQTRGLAELDLFGEANESGLPSAPTSEEDFARYLDEARALLSRTSALHVDSESAFSEEIESLRWFTLPKEVASERESRGTSS